MDENRADAAPGDVSSGAWTMRFALTCLLEIALFVALLREPLFWAFHFEFAFIANLFLIVVGGAWCVASLWPGAGAFDSSEGLERSLYRVAVLAGLPLLLAIGAQMVVGSCDPLEGFAWYALLPGVGAFFVWALATLAALAARSRRRAFLFYSSLVAGLVLLFFGRLYFGVSFRGFNLLLGYWPGVLYDEFVPIGRALQWARGEALCAALAVLCFAAALLKDRPRFAWLGLVFVVGFTGLSAAEGRARIHPSREQIERELGGVVETKHARWVVGEGKALKLWPVLAARADFQIEQLSWELGLENPPRPTIYLFESAEDKRRWIGAKHTFVTRPWKRELYLHVEGRAHEVLRHELVHLLTGEWGLPLLAIPPNIALLEGLARHLGGDWSQVSSEDAVAAAVLAQRPDLPLERLLRGLGFWEFSPALAYPLAGAFVGYLRSPGVLSEPFGEFYARGGPSDSKEWPRLIENWRAYLKGIEPSEVDRAVAARMLAQRPLYEKRCAHEVAECLNVATDGKLFVGTKIFDAAVARALLLDPNRDDVRALFVRSLRLPEELNTLRAALPDLESDAPLSSEQALAVGRYSSQLAQEGNWEEAARWLALLTRSPIWPHRLGWYQGVAWSVQAQGKPVLIEGEGTGWRMACRWEESTGVCSEYDEDPEIDLRPVELQRVTASPQVLYSFALEKYLEELAHGEFDGSARWAGRMAEIPGLDPELETLGALLRDESEWLAQNISSYQSLTPR